MQTEIFRLKVLHKNPRRGSVSEGSAGLCASRGMPLFPRAAASALCGPFPPLMRLGTGQNVPGLICVQRDNVNVRNLKDIKLLRRDVHPGLSWPSLTVV